MQIQNVVTTADLKQRIDGRKFVDYPWGTYDLEYYGGKCGYVKDPSMQGKVTVFLTGKLISTGAKTIPNSIKQLHHVMHLLVDAGLARKVRLEPIVQNMVGVLNVQSHIDINALFLLLPKSTLEPEVFPALIYRTGYGTTCLIFSSGKIVISGAKSDKAISDTERDILVKLRKLKKLTKN